VLSPGYHKQALPIAHIPKATEHSSVNGAAFKLMEFLNKSPFFGIRGVARIGRSMKLKRPPSLFDQRSPDRDEQGVFWRRMGTERAQQQNCSQAISDNNHSLVFVAFKA
jgi:hypothetical protein